MIFSVFFFLFFQLLDTLDLKSSSGIDRVEKVFSKLNWNSFPGVQSLLLKVRPAPSLFIVITWRTDSWNWKRKTAHFLISIPFKNNSF